jgi:hypothetical protein
MSEFALVTSLADRDALNPLPDREVQGGPLFVGKSVARFDGDRRSVGHDRITVYPACLAGEWCWLIHRRWCPARGYCASGELDEILSFEDGIRLMVEHGVFSWIFPGGEETQDV